MRNAHYKVRHIRIEEEAWEFLKHQKRASGLTWNLYVLKLLGTTRKDFTKKPKGTV